MKESSTRPICTQLTWLHVPSFHRREYPVATSTTTARQGCNCATLPRFGFYKSYRSLKRSEMLLAGCFTRVARDIRAKRRYWGENAFNEQRGRHFRDAPVRLGQIFLFEYWRKRIRLRIFDRSAIKGKGSCGQFGIILAKWIFNFFGGGGGRLIVLLSYYSVSVDISVVEFRDESRGSANYKKNWDRNRSYILGIFRRWRYVSMIWKDSKVCVDINMG